MRLDPTNPAPEERAAPEPTAVLSRDDLDRLIDEAFVELDALVRPLTAEQLALPVWDQLESDQGWHVRDAVLHIAGWKRNAARVAALMALPGAEADDRFPSAILGFVVGDYNNERVLEWRGRGDDEVLREHRDAHDAMVNAIAGLPDELLLVGGHAVTWLTPALWHSRFHARTHIAKVVSAGSTKAR